MTYGIIYGAEGADYPDVYESDPYTSPAAALRDLDRTIFDQYGGAVLIEDYKPSDGQTITSGHGRVVKEIAL